MSSPALISIITVNYKQAEVTNQMLASLQRLTWPNIEVLVIENNSGDDDYLKINRTYPNTSIIRSDRNRGFAGGNNLGIAKAKGDYILLLNNDTEVTPNFIEPMLELFTSDPSIGAVSPKIKYFYAPDTIQYAGFSAMNWFTLRMKAWGSKQKDCGQFDRVMQTQFAHGCAMMVSRKVIDAVGMMPEDYFLYYEEHDWSYSIRRAGFRILYQPQSVVFHKESVSVQRNSPLKTYYINRNRILFMRRNFGWFRKLLASMYLLFVSVPKNVLKYVLTANFVHLRAYCDAILWNVLQKNNVQWKQ